VDGEDFSFLEIRKLDFSQPADPEPLTQDATAR
jgi:hypothetical protein